MICKALRTFTPTDRSYTFIIRFALLVAEARVIILPHTATFRRCTGAAPIRSLLDDMHVFPAGRAIVVIAGFTFAPTNRPNTMKAGFALLIAESCVIVFACFTLFWYNPCATAVRFLSIDMGISAAGAAVVVVPFRTLGTALVCRQAAFVIPGTF